METWENLNYFTSSDHVTCQKVAKPNNSATKTKLIQFYLFIIVCFRVWNGEFRSNSTRTVYIIT